jgi:hypothetical protein
MLTENDVSGEHCSGAQDGTVPHRSRIRDGGSGMHERGVALGGQPQPGDQLQAPPRVSWRRHARRQERLRMILDVPGWSNDVDPLDPLSVKAWIVVEQADDLPGGSVPVYCANQFERLSRQPSGSDDQQRAQ